MAEVLRNLKTQIGQAFSVDEMSSNNDMRLLNNAPPSTQPMGTSHQNAQLPQPVGTMAGGGGTVGSDEFDPFAGVTECVDENVDVSLNAPPEEKWYHGRLDRQKTEERLAAAAKLGSYLIRESDRRPGSYVLSYLGKTGFNHFRITAMCGDYYIGGRQFASLSDLIGYYTSWSDLLKAERLVHPVAPLEPINDKRQVVAILPYNKVAETDELSFQRGDVFTVYNEMGDGWLWVKSLRTKESGIIFSALVEDMTKNADPNEGKEWFHGNITKEAAAERLGQAGPGSFLIRPSDNSPGDYSLFFHVNNTIQRFRIQSQGRYFVMGGRYFDSLDAIIERYKKEQIVEGHTLCRPAAKSDSRNDGTLGFGSLQEPNMNLPEPVISEQHVKIYESIPKMQTNFIGQKDDKIIIRGYLNFLNKKVDKKTKKWKNLYFVLNGTEQHLYYFENTKRSKPKGLIDLSYAALYPVHDSFFDRSNCFQVVVKALNHQEVYYFCAESQDRMQEWMKAILPFCAKSAGTANQASGSGGRVGGLREMRSLIVAIQDAHRLPAKYVNHPYFLVALNDINACRTRVKEAPNPIFDEEYTLDDLPGDIDFVTISLFNKRPRSKDVHVAQITVHLKELDNGELIEEWFQLSPVSPQMKGDMGSVRVKVKYMHELIMPAHEYGALKELTVSKDFEVVFALADVAGHDRVPLARALLSVFQEDGQEAILLRVMNDREIEQEDDTSTLFRSSTMATCLMDQYMKRTCGDFLNFAIKKSIISIMESRDSCELDLSRLDRASDAHVNAEHLLVLLNDVIESIFDSAHAAPPVLRYICGCLQKSVSSKWPENEIVRTRVVSVFIFLRLLSPAIRNPKSFNLITETPSETADRTLTLVAKCLQNLANLVEFGAKEPYMNVVNPFIVRNKARMVEFLNELSNVHENPCSGNQMTSRPSIRGFQSSPHAASNASRGSSDIARELACLHHICETHLQELDVIGSQGGGSNKLRKLIAMTDMLCGHKKHYMQQQQQQQAGTLIPQPPPQQQLQPERMV